MENSFVVNGPPSAAHLLVLNRFQRSATLDDFDAIFGPNGAQLYHEFNTTCKRNLLRWFEHYCPFKRQADFLNHVFKTQ